MGDYGWIKLHRELLFHPIWQNSTPEQKTVLVTLLCMANHQHKKWEWRGKEFEARPGQFVTSLNSIVKACGRGVTIKNVRTALNRFEKLGFLASESTNTGRLITIENWSKWQVADSETGKASGREMANTGQAPGKHRATNKNGDNEIKYIVEIVAYLNSKCGTSFKASTKATQEHINARLGEGFTLEDFRKVIDTKAAEWINDAGMRKYLRPQTLFGKNFESYLNQQRQAGNQRRVITHDQIEAMRAQEEGDRW